MATLADVTSNVADMLSRADLNTQIEREIVLACEFYSRTPTFIMERRGGTFNTIAEQQWYDTVNWTASAGTDPAPGVANVDQIITIRYAKLEPGASGLDERLIRVHYTTLESYTEGSSTSSWPTYFAMHAQQIGLWPIPSQLFQVYISADVKPVLPSAPGDGSAYFDFAQEMIEFAAAERVARKYLTDIDRAAVYKAGEREQWQSIMGESTRKASTGRIRSRA